MAGPSVALLGAGIVAELYAKAFERGAGARFAGVFDPEAPRAQRLAARLGGTAYASREALLADAAVDAVLVLSPNHCHFEDARAALAAGKHVLVEKPVAETHAELGALQAAAQAAGRVCMPAHNYIYMEPVVRLRRLLAEGRFGTLASLWMLYNIFHHEDVARRYGGVLREVAVHHAYALLYLVGRPLTVAAHATRLHYETLDAEDQVLLTCTLAGGALANLWVSFAASDRTSDPWTVLYKALGTRGGTSFSWNDSLFEDEGGPAWGITNYVDSFHRELETFAGEVVGTARMLSTLADAGDALRIIEAAERSLREGGRAVAVAYD
jgi:predicted dehydrogenase